MKLALASLIQQITRRSAAEPRRATLQAPSDPFDRLARIVRVERAREAAVLRTHAPHHAG
jgi:hypothetical protein